MAHSRMSEQDLLRELLFTLDGVSGSLIKFDPVLDAFTVSPSTVFCVRVDSFRW